MRILVVGLGSIAQRHIRNIKSLSPKAKIAVFRQKTKKVDKDCSKVVDQFFFNWDEAFGWDPHLVLITNPASFHIKTALRWAQKGCHLFIEKPLSHNLVGVDQLLKICKKKQLVLMVGYNMRFLEPLVIIKQALEEGKIGRILYVRASVGQYLPDWRPKSDYRQGVSARKSLGGGAVLELSHELDYIRWFIGEFKSVLALTKKLSDLKIDVEDTAEIILESQQGMLVSIHLDMIDRLGNRCCQIVGTQGSLLWESQRNNRVRLFSAQEHKWKELRPAKALDINKMYLEELSHFFECVDSNTTPCVSGEDGRRIVEVILAIQRSSQKQKRIKL